MSNDVRARAYAKARTAFERRAQTLVGLKLAAIRYMGGANSVGYEHATGIDMLDFGVELVGDDGRCVYITWEFGDFNLAILECTREERRPATDVSADGRWRPFVGRTVTNVGVASHVDNTPWTELPFFLERPLGFFLMRSVRAAAVYDASDEPRPPSLWLRNTVLLGSGARWIINKIGRTRPRQNYVPFGLTLHFGDRRVWLAAPRDEEDPVYSMSVVFEEEFARRLELVV